MPDYFESGFVVREPAWHGLAEVLDDYPGDWNAARRHAGLDWEPVEEQVYARRDVTGDSPLAEYHYPIDIVNPLTPVDGFKVVRRSDTGAILTIAHEDRGIFPNAELGPLVESFLSEPDVQYETAGVLKEGRKVWVMVRLREPFHIPGDPHGATLSRLAVQNSHDGSAALRVQRLQTRIVCDNTSQAADREAGKHGHEFVFRHTKNIREYVEQARHALDGLRSDQERYTAWAHDLMGLRVNGPQLESFVQTFIPQPVGDVVSDRVRRNVEDAQGTLRDILWSETTYDVKFTAYGLVQGAVEYLDHARSYRSAETHFTRSYLRPEPLKRKAEEIAREVATA